LLGDDFAQWHSKRLGLCVGTFKTKDCEDKEYIKIIPAPEVTSPRGGEIPF